MWIVRLALRRPYTFAVFAILLLLIGAYSILTMPTDIFPNINIPVVSIVWQYAGLSAEEMANRIVAPSERSMTTTVNDIEHIESQSLNGIGVIKIFFQPHVDIGSAVAEVTAIMQVQLRQLPPGTTPPFIIQYNASSVPVLQLGLSGQGLSEQQLGDIGTNLLRTRLATVEGASIPYPYGGKQRQIQVDLDLHAMQAKGVSPNDVVTAINAQNLIVPSGTMKVGTYEYAIETNSAPPIVDELNNMPIKAVNGAVIYIRDVAHVRDGFPPQTNIVRVDGQRSALMNILKTGSASTLDIIAGIREKLPAILAQLPPQLRISPLNDQSVFVKGAISGVVREAIIAACLTGIMILIFLGSWRSTIIIAVSIPLSILSSLICLSALGETINIMTLGGLALAVGILVDDATVEIENINRNLEAGKEIEQAILDGAAQIAVPAFVSTLSICIVFVPMFFLSGVSRYLFVPLAEAVVFAMLASYLLSRTVVPTMAKYLLKEHDDAEAGRKKTSRNPFVAFQRGFEHYFEKIRGGYVRILTFTVDHPMAFIVAFLLICVASVGLLGPWLGQDFFPSVDSGAFRIHVRARTGTRIEETASLCDHIDNAIRREIPTKEVVTIIDNIGLPYSGLNLSYSTSAPVGTADADITVQLSEDHHPTGAYVNNLRESLAREFPGVTFYVLPVDIVTQILNFGLSSPIDIQVIGPDLQHNRVYAEKLLNDVKYIAGTADTRIQQPFDQPKFTVNVDRTRSQELGLTQRDVSGSLLVALSGSFQTTPNFYLDPKNGVSYNIAVQSPQYNIQSVPQLQSLPVTPAASAAMQPVANTGANPTGAPGSPQSEQILGNLSTIAPGTELGTVSHYDIQPVLDIYANVEGADLGSVTRKIEAVIAKHKSEVPHGTQIVLRGQSETMTKSYIGLLAGLAFSILLVYFLIVINFQSWLDPFLIISALPAAITGIVWFLFLTNTRLSVPALTGTIMCMGVATANSILVVTFAREQLEVLVGDARKAALNAGFVRFRPVLMTALAMIIGMVPMALGLGDGGEQNAPLGRAVIGGLLLATVATLFFVPTFFSALHGRIERNARRKRAQTQSTVVDEQFPEQI
jgi:multidrug efflux pump subunit AcrB